MVTNSVNLIWEIASFATLILKMWALFDVIVRPAEAFPFLNRQTKNAWIAITASSVVTHFLWGAFGITGIIGVIACAVYLADIRPKILEMLNNRK
jgi:hypothetical protein